jgi:hypothetical protein
MSQEIKSDISITPYKFSIPNFDRNLTKLKICPQTDYFWDIHSYNGLVKARLNVSSMINAYRKGWFLKLLFSTILLFSSLQSLPARAETNNKTIYSPVDLPENNEVNDTLTEKDIPTGEGAFARDYLVSLKKGDQVAIDLTSEDFDTIVLLLGEDGTTVAENDDGPDGTTNSLLFVRIITDGNYIIRVRGFGETGGGKFNLKMTPLATIQSK